MICQILIRVTVELKEKLKKEAGKRGQTLNALILQILWEWAEKQGA